MHSRAFNPSPGSTIIMRLALFGAISLAAIFSWAAAFGLWWTVNHVAFR